ncbi:MAG: flagellar type III secretion system pore protein FliP [Cellvibrionaceae bacterium]
MSLQEAVRQPIGVFLVLLILLLGAWSGQSYAQSDTLGATAEAISSSADSPQGIKGIPGLPALTVKTNDDGTQDYTVTLQILAIMTSLSLLPAMLMMMTSFTRIIIVFAILRQALGLQQSPSNQILIGLTLFLTFFIMTPVFKEVNEQTLQPYINESITAGEAFDRIQKPFHAFMLAQTRESDIALFMEIADQRDVQSAEELPMNILVPAFVTSELKTAFQIGFIIFIPFLVIDIVVASVLMAMGMMMLSPLIISLPFKIMLFVLVDGWALIIGTLAASYG